MSTFAKSEDPDEMTQDEIWAKIHHNVETLNCDPFNI